jgi:alpha-1,6-mannosyltransferase
VRHAIVVPAARDATDSLFDSTVYRLAGPSAPASPGYHVLLKPRALRRILRREQPDVIEVGSVYIVPWLLRYAARGCGARMVGFLHMDLRTVLLGRLPHDTPTALTRGAGAVLSAYLRAAYRPCHRVVAASRCAAQVLDDEGIPNAWVPLGVDTALFHPQRRDPAWRSTVGASGNRPVGLYVGRLAVEKHLHTLADALPQLHHRLGLHLVVIGEGHMRPRLERLARRHPRLLTVCGYEPDRQRLATAYASADVCFAPSPEETFGLSVLEAAAAGLPVVGANAGGVGELLQGQQWAATFEAGDPAGLAAATASLLARDPAGMRAGARQLAESYSWDRTFGRLLDVYREAAAT